MINSVFYKYRLDEQQVFNAFQELIYKHLDMDKLMEDALKTMWQDEEFVEIKITQLNNFDKYLK
jgi:hypothetical protein